MEMDSTHQISTFEKIFKNINNLPTIRTKAKILQDLERQKTRYVNRAKFHRLRHTRI